MVKKIFPTNLKAIKFYLIFLLCCCNNSFSQNSNKLDSNFSLGNYKLDSDYKFYAKELIYKFTATSNPNLKVYRSIKKNLKIVGIDKVKEISLMFYKEKLYTINIDFEGYLSNYQESSIVSDLIKLLGHPTNFVSNPALKDDSNYEVIKQFEWKSNKSVLLFIKIGSPNYQHNLALFSSEIQTQILLDKFN